jgi:hypothetical protein
MFLHVTHKLGIIVSATKASSSPPHKIRRGEQTGLFSGSERPVAYDKNLAARIWRRLARRKNIEDSRRASVVNLYAGTELLITAHQRQGTF